MSGVDDDCRSQDWVCHWSGHAQKFRQWGCLLTIFTWAFLGVPKRTTVFNDQDLANHDAQKQEY